MSTLWYTKPAVAAAETLRVRIANGGGHTGWSRAWIINFYAKLWDGEKAWENGKLTRCAVTADQAYEGEVVYGEMRQAVKLEKGETVILDAVLQLLES